MELPQKRFVLLLVIALLAAGMLWVWRRKGDASRSRLGGRNCPFCLYYNATDETRCTRCSRWLPPPWLTPLFRQSFLTEWWATKLLAGISLFVFALQMAVAGPKSLGLLRGMPASVLLRFGAIRNGLETAEPWRLLASCFVHMGVLHIAMNMMALADLGRMVEQELKGPRVVLIYVITGIAGFLVTPFWFSRYLSAGASGAIFGLDGALIGLLLSRGDPRWKQIAIRTVVYSFVFYFVFGTNQAAHLGGLVTGFGLGLLFGRESRPWRLATAVNVAAAVSLVLVVTSLVLPHFSSQWQAEAAREYRTRTNE